ncbi:MAG TPA: hypothetical protein VMP12_12440 [Candidatus Sulfotelmatobacter sp.]|nr:hypothetical protein [Candidatus Sulfotelmatobacter sp.]
MKLKRILGVCLLAGCGVGAIETAVAPASRGAAAQKTSMESSRANRSKVTIEGLVRDVACPIQNLDGNATSMSMECVMGCVKGGSPIAILTKDGDLYLPISDKMPDYDQRQKLMPFVGKYVRAKGIAFERNGTRAIVISEIVEMKDVHVRDEVE